MLPRLRAGARRALQRTAEALFGDQPNPDLNTFLLKASGRPATRTPPPPAEASTSRGLAAMRPRDALLTIVLCGAALLLLKSTRSAAKAPKGAGRRRGSPRKAAAPAARPAAPAPGRLGRRPKRGS